MYRYVKSSTENDKRSAFRNAAESLGWTVTIEDMGPNWMYIALYKTSPDGEDVIVEFQCDSFEEAVERVEVYYKDFDKEDHVDMWLSSYDPRALWSRERLMKDSEAIENMLKSLYEAVRDAIA